MSLISQHPPLARSLARPSGDESRFFGRTVISCAEQREGEEIRADVRHSLTDAAAPATFELRKGRSGEGGREPTFLPCLSREESFISVTNAECTEELGWHNVGNFLITKLPTELAFCKFL